MQHSQVKHKNEFIASLANQYFGSTKDMFRLALQKAEEGNYNQINQFVLMASIFSQDDKSLFYQIEPRGTIRRTPHNIVKKDDLVTHLRLGKKTYQFVYTDGVITGIR